MAQLPIQARTVSIGANSTENLPTVSEGPVEVIVRASGAGVFIGNIDLDSNKDDDYGYELTPNQEYRFTFASVVASNPAYYTPYLWNSTGSPVTVSWCSTAKEA